MKGDDSAGRFVLITIFPVGLAQLGLAPFWFAHAYATSPWLPFAAIFLMGVLLPVYLAVVGCRLVLGHFPVSIPAGLCVLLVVSALNLFLDYSAWGSSTGQFWTPDDGTIEVEHLMMLTTGSILIVPTLVTWFAQLWFQRFVRAA